MGLLSQIEVDATAKHLQILPAAILRMMRPLVRVLLRSGMTFKTFSDLAKRVFVEVGMAEFAIEGKRQTISRVAILTGLSRKEVQRVLNERTPKDAETHERYNRASRVVAGWVRDGEFTNDKGEPAALLLEGTPSFAQLVKRYSGDIPARAVLDELLRVGAVRSIKGGRIKLVSRAYVPRTSNLDKLAILGTDVAYLIKTIDHNMEYGERDPYFQRKVMYDNVPQEAISKLRMLSAEQSQKLIEQLDKRLSRHDRDVNQAVKGTGRKRVGIGIYYFEEDLASQPAEEAK